jgi:hypothetical protein
MQRKISSKFQNFSGLCCLKRPTLTVNLEFIIKQITRMMGIALPKPRLDRTFP